MSTSAQGRHRASGRLNPVHSLSAALVRGARPALTATASVAAAGGMVAALSGPASAAPAAPQAPSSESVVLSGTSSARVSYGLQLVNPAPAVAPAKTTFKTVTVANRQRPAATVAATTTTARTATATAAPAARVSTVAANVGAAPAPARGVLGIAAGLSGIPYSWGGTSTGGFDCSGYTQYVFRQAGISLPRTAGAQRAATRYISRASAVPGDLVFFGTYHVGIYAGGNMMYDSPSSGGTTGLHSIWSSDVTFGRVG